MKKRYLFRVMRLLILLLMAGFMHVTASSLAQTVTLEGRNLSFKKVLQAIKKQSGYEISGSSDVIDLGQPVTVSARQMPLDDFLRTILADQPIDFEMDERTIVLLKKNNPTRNSMIQRSTAGAQQRTVRGQVLDQQGNPLARATVTVIGDRSKTTATDDNGYFTLTDIQENTSVVITAMGYTRMVLTVLEDAVFIQRLPSGEEYGTTVTGSAANFSVRLLAEMARVEDVVITGIVKRDAASFTGSAKVMSGEELRQISPTNIFTAIQALDPSFRITPNNELGGDINALPEITVRGEGSFPTLGDELAGVQNLPLFILDGFEVNLRQVADLDMNRIESITILKDASSTSMYGARGANGVMVITTIVPPPGKLEVSLTNSFTYSAPDLSVYDLLNTEEKLIFEERAGLRNTYVQQYRWAERYKEMLRGVDTDWKQIPTQTGFSNRTTLSIGGGDQVIRYNMGFNGQLLQGVMKEQDRHNYSGNFTFQYNVSNKFNIRNTTTATQTVSNASPYGNFSSYLSFNPYTRPYNEDGTPSTYIEYITVPNTTDGNANVRTLNPLADLQFNTINDRNKSFSLVNQTQVEVFLTQHLRLNGNFGINKTNGRIDNFKSAFDSEFANETDPTRRGRYSVNSSESLALDAQTRAVYSNRIGLHTFNANANFDVRTASSEGFTLNTLGFPSDKLDFLLFASQYQPDSRPSGSESTINTLSYGGALNYNYDNRYIGDFSFTRQGSSAYGDRNRYSGYWSAGLGWNLHNEAFFGEIHQVNSLRIYGSYGSTGSSATDAYASQFRYNFSNNTSYYGNLGALLAGLGNLDLGPQNRLKANIGLSAGFFGGRLGVGFDVYDETTQNSLASVTLAPSTGFSSYTENLGKIQNRGMNFDVSYQVINNLRRLMRWTIGVNGTMNKSTLLELSEKMKTFNELISAGRDNVAIPQYVEGNSMTGIYTVPSLGVDPITGQEIFVKRDGSLTYLWDTNDRVMMGDSNPTIAGSVNSTFSYRGFSIGFSLRYEYGGQLYNTTLATRVEGVNAVNNVDRRAYDLGWINPGDITRFRRVGVFPNTPRSTSRLLQDNNSLELQSLSAGYVFEDAFVRRLGLRNLSVRLNTNSTVRWSTIRIERGTQNPFARDFTLNLSTRF